MNVKDVKGRVADIKKLTWDEEAAHSAEDQLYCDLLHAIAGGRCDNVIGCAKEALKTKKLDFSRWYA